MLIWILNLKLFALKEIMKKIYQNNLTTVENWIIGESFFPPLFGFFYISMFIFIKEEGSTEKERTQEASSFFHLCMLPILQQPFTNSWHVTNKWD